ncbi:MAG: InlB B-repeat-containing protein [Lachnospiraceae bacterium]|nr:InlB B-repeat-containing protein [Lachnospiraceae bacterium]
MSVFLAVIICLVTIESLILPGVSMSEAKRSEGVYTDHNEETVYSDYDEETENGTVLMTDAEDADVEEESGIWTEADQADSPEDAAEAEAPDQEDVSADGEDQDAEDPSAEDSDEAENPDDPEETAAEVAEEADGDFGASETADAFPAQIFEAHTERVSVRVDADEGALPAGVTMEVAEVTDEDVIESVRDAAQDQAGSADAEDVRAVDISFVTEQGEKVEPLLPVRVVLTSDIVEKSDNPVVVHLDDEGETEVVELLEEPDLLEELADDQVAFDSERFSVYAIVGTTIERTVLAGDGQNYRITASFGPETGIPENADLEVYEILPDSDPSAGNRLSYGEYVSRTENVLGMEDGSAGYIRLFDIKIVDKDDHSVVYQPAEGTSVDVRMELDDKDIGEEAAAGTQVVHFADEDEEPAVIENIDVEGTAVRFEAPGFSVYAIIDTADTDPSGTVSRKYEFYTDDTFGTEFTFINREGEQTSVQYVTEGGMLYNPDAPLETVSGKQFLGWADETGTIVIAPGTEGTVITGVTGTDTVVRLYPRYDEVYYIEYYDEHHNVYKTESSVNGDFTMSGMTADLMEGEEYRITYQPDDSEEAFMGWSLEDHSLDTVSEVDFTGDADRKIELYPAKAKVFWINFDKNDAGGTSKATYTAPVWVLQTDDKVSDRHTSLPESTRPGYDFGGWYTDPECNTPFDMNTHLTGDITLYANWIPADQTYTVVILKQRISDSVTATAEEKTYDYETSYAIHGTTGSTASVPNQYKNLNFDGFDYARCDDNTAIAADGSTVLYVYYDRKIVTFNFYLYGSTGATVNYTTINENRANDNYDDSINVYGDYQGNKVVLTRTSSSSTRYYLSEGNYNGAPEYIGTVYELRNNRYVEATEPYSTGRTYYYRYWQSYWPFGGEYRYSRLNWRRETTTTYTWYTPDGNEYTGPFYRQTQTQAGTRWYIWKSMTGLYGSSLNGEWPSEYWWYSDYSGSTGRGTRTTFLDAFLPAGTSTEVNYYGNTGSGTSSIRFYQQNVDGETYSLPSGGTVTSTSNASFNLTDKYNGFHIAEYRTRRNGSWSSWIEPGELMLQNGSYYYDADPNTYGYQSIPSGYTDLEIRYDRNLYTIDFLDGFSHSNTELADSASVLYGCPVENADPGAPDVTHEGYTFTGWYTDPDCKNLFDFSSETMPANNLVLYAGWEKQRFRVWVQPNGGILSPTESTFFRTDYGELIQEYSDVEVEGRNYYASDDGEYSYVYICDPENHDQARVAYYKKTSELGVITLQKQDENGNIINDVYDEREWTDGKKYTYQKGVYDFVGWYRVDGEISELVPPEILETDELTLWNFNTPVTEPVAIRAIWKRVGSFRVGYDKNMYDEDGNAVVIPGAEDAEVPPTTLYTYGDLSQAIVGQAPTKVPDNYTFVGWRTPAGEIVQPNDTITIHSSLATLEDGSNTSDPKYLYKLTAVYKQLDATSLVYDANGGTGTLSDLAGTAAESEDAVYGNNQITKLELNSKLTLSAGAGFIREGYKLTGWNDDRDAAYHEIVKYELGGTYGIDNPEGNTLYAVWELLRMPVPFVKEGEKDDGTYEQLAGAEFRLYTDSDCGTLISDDDRYKQVVKETDAVVISTTENGTNVTFPKVPVGTFYFKETSVDSRYTLDSTVHTLEVTESEDGNHTLSFTIDGSDTSSNPFVVRNYLKGTLVISKTVDSVVKEDMTRNFSFTAAVLNAANETDTTFNGTYGDLTFKDGVADFTLKHGEAVKIRNMVGRQIAITEHDAEVYTTTAAAASATGSYDGDGRSFTITVPDDGDTVNFVNKLEGVPVRVLKVDQTGAALEGAGFYFTGKDFDGNEEDEIERKTRYVSQKADIDSEEAVIIEREAVPVGTYVLHEETVPAGYIAPDGDVEITVATGTDGNIEVSLKAGETQYTGPTYISRVDGTWVIKIMNSEGYELPSTGGPGPGLIYLLGIMLVSLSGAGLVMRRRKRYIV